jgi:hypothetical protein
VSPACVLQLFDIGDIGDGLGDIGDGIGDGLGDLGDGIGDGLTDGLDFGLDGLTDFGDTLGGAFTDVGDFFTDDVSSLLVDGIGGWFENAGLDAADFFENAGLDMGNWLGDAAGDTAGWVTGDFVNLINIIGDKTGDWVANDFTQFFTTDLADFFTEDVGGLGEDIGEFGTLIFNGGIGLTLEIGDFVVDVGSDIGNGVADLALDGIDFVGDTAGEVGDFFEGDFVDFFEGDFVDFFTEDIGNFATATFIDFLQAIGLAPGDCEACGKNLDGQDMNPMEMCYLPVSEALGGAEGSTSKGMCDTETKKFANAACLKVDEGCGSCWSGDQSCVGSTQVYDPTEVMCTTGKNAASIAMCFNSPDPDDTESRGFCDADRKAFGHEACHQGAVNPDTKEVGKSLAEVCAKYYPDSACTDCSADDGVCVAVTATYDPVQDMCTKEGSSIGRCFDVHTSADKGLCHEDIGLFLNAACNTGKPHPETGEPGPSIASTCGKYYPDSPCSEATATLSEEQMAAHNEEIMCAPGGMCTGPLGACYAVKGVDPAPAVCDGDSGLFLSSNCKMVTKCGVCFPDSPCSDADDVATSAQQSEAQEEAANAQWCKDQCTGVAVCWDTTLQGMCNADTGYFLSSQCSAVTACSSCFPESPCVDAAGTKPYAAPTTTTITTPADEVNDKIPGGSTDAPTTDAPVVKDLVAKADAAARAAATECGDCESVDSADKICTTLCEYVDADCDCESVVAGDAVCSPLCSFVAAMGSESDSASSVSAVASLAAAALIAALL